MISNPQFQADYRKIFERCVWATPNQHPNFIGSWYSCYRETMSPFLALGYRESGELVAILPLARDTATRQLLVAGMPQIDYVAWLCSVEVADDFIVAVLQQLARVAVGSLRFRYLAPGIPTGWQSRTACWKGGMRRLAIARPVIKLDDPSELRANLKKKDNKSKLNRLARIGEVRAYTVVGRDELNRWIGELSLYCDLRQGAINDSTPFLEDEQKREFHLRLAESKDLLHTTVLTVGDRLAAALICLCWNGSAAVGLFAISPVFQKHSPGKILVYETAIRLADAGYRELDLTPGGAWKDRFASQCDSVDEVEITFGRTRHVAAKSKSGAAQAARRLLRSFGVDPGRAATNLRRITGLSSASALRKIRVPLKWLWSNQESRVYQINMAPGRYHGSIELSRNQFADLLKFRPRATWQSKAAFFRESIDKISSGAELFSLVRNDTLAHYGWLSIRQAASYFPEIGASYEYPENSAVLFDYYTDPEWRGQGFDQCSLQQMSEYALGQTGIERVYVSVRAENAPFRYVIEKCGFEHVASLFRNTRFGKSRVRRVEIKASKP